MAEKECCQAWVALESLNFKMFLLLSRKLILLCGDIYQFLEVKLKMAVKIRLRRMGAKKAPFYRIVVADSRFPRDGRFIEELGYYNPLKNPIELKVNDEKVKNWIKNGAQPTDTVKSLFKKFEIL